VLYDAHNHLQDEWLAPHLDRIAADLAAAGVAGAVVNGTCAADWPAVSALATRFPWVHPSFGLHPWDAGNASPGWRDALQRTLDAHPFAAVGEIGLDRWILDRARPDDPRLAGLRRAPLAEQVDAFRWQLALAAERDLPVTIHCLDAWGALTEVLDQSPRPRRGFLLHAYGGPAELVPRFAALGAYFSFNGSFLPPPPAGAGPAASADSLRARTSRAERVARAFAAVPPDRILMETDAPAMPLPPGRSTHELPPAPGGTPLNHPANLAAAYTGAAELLAVPSADLTARVAANFTRFFLHPPA
jgi:TatD DNase family protein